MAWTWQFAEAGEAKLRAGLSLDALYTHDGASKGLGAALGPTLMLRSPDDVGFPLYVALVPQAVVAPVAGSASVGGRIGVRSGVGVWTINSAALVASYERSFTRDASVIFVGIDGTGGGAGRDHCALFC